MKIKIGIDRKAVLLATGEDHGEFAEIEITKEQMGDDWPKLVAGLVCADAVENMFTSASPISCPTSKLADSPANCGVTVIGWLGEFRGIAALQQHAGPGHFRTVAIIGDQWTTSW